MPSRRRRSWNKEEAARQGGLTVPQMRRRKVGKRPEAGTLRVCNGCGAENDPPRVQYDLQTMQRLYAFCVCGQSLGEVPRTKEWDAVHWGQRFG